MYIFSKNYKNTINKEFIKKVNILDYQKIISKKGEFLNLAYSNLKLKKQQKAKLKHLLVLELVSYKKGFFFYEINKSKRKKMFLSSFSYSNLYKKDLEYFCFNFMKFYAYLSKNIYGFFLDNFKKRIELESIDSFSLLSKNNFYFYDIKNLVIQKENKNLINHSILQKLSFYKLKL